MPAPTTARTEAGSLPFRPIDRRSGFPRRTRKRRMRTKRGMKRKLFKRLMIFVPEGKREPTDLPVDLYDKWVSFLLKRLSHLFGGATAFGRGIGAWKEGEGADAPVHFDRVTVVEALIAPKTKDLGKRLDDAIDAIEQMRESLREKVIGYALDGVLILHGPSTEQP